MTPDHQFSRPKLVFDEFRVLIVNGRNTKSLSTNWRKRSLMSKHSTLLLPITIITMDSSEVNHYQTIHHLVYHS